MFTGSVGHLHVVPMATQFHRNKLRGHSWRYMRTVSNYNTPACTHLRLHQTKGPMKEQENEGSGGSTVPRST